MSVPPIAAELVERRQVLPGQHLDSFHAPVLAMAVRAGQLVSLLLAGADGLLMRRAFPVNTADPATGLITIHHQGEVLATAQHSAAGRPAAGAAAGFAAGALGQPTAGPGGMPGPPRRRPDPLAALRVGDVVPLAGPLGRPFELDPRSSHLLLVAEGPAIAALRLLADEALRDGRQVTVLFGATGARDVYPSSLLPDEAEYVVATLDGSMGARGSVADLVPAYEAWADQAFAAGPPELLGRLAALAASRRGRMGVAKLGRKRGAGRLDPPGSPAARRKAFLQVALPPTLACAEATCLGCVVEAAPGVPGLGLLRSCREGPAFAADELAWEAGA